MIIYSSQSPQSNKTEGLFKDVDLFPAIFCAYLYLQGHVFCQLLSNFEQWLQSSVVVAIIRANHVVQLKVS